MINTSLLLVIQQLVQDECSVVCGVDINYYRITNMFEIWLLCSSGLITLL